MATVTLDTFELSHAIGRGGMGVVFAAHHVPTGLSAAVKVAYGALSPRLRLDAEAEIRAVASLSHPGVIRLYDRGEVPEEAAAALGVAAGAPWIAMERARGAAPSRAPGPVVRTRLGEALAALAHAHARGVLHLDLKPGNLLIAEDGALLLGDFGIARLIGQPQGPEDASARRGTLAAMAPEQIVGDAPSFGPWTDLYALGCTAFAWVAGAWPWPPLDLEAAARARSARPVRLPRGGPLADWIAWLTAPDPRDRPQCAAQALAALPEPQAFATGADEAAGAAPTVATLATSVTGVAPAPAHQPEAPAAARWRRGGLPIEAVGVGLLPFRRWPLVGRERALAELDAELDAVAATGSPRLIGVSAGPGMGRTATLRAFLERAHEAGRAQVVGALGPARGLAAELVRLDVAADPGDLAACARRRPLVLAIDDVADRAAWMAVARRLLARDDLPVLVVVTARADLAAGSSEVPRWIPLEPLSPAQSASLLADLADLEPREAARLVEQAGGCPLFLVRTLEGWAANGHLAPGPSGLFLRGGPPLPSDVTAALLGPLAALADREGTAALAVLEPPVEPERWSRITDDAGDALLRALLASGAVVRSADGLGFASEGTRAAVLDRTPPERLRDLHQRALDADPPTPLARGRHALGAGRPELACDPLDEATLHALTVGEVRAASRIAEEWGEALAPSPSDDPRRVRHALSLAQIAHLQARFDDAVAHALVAVRLAPELVTRARARQLAAAARQRAGALREALAWFEEAAEGFGEVAASGDAYAGSRRVECLVSVEEVLTVLGDESGADAALARALAHLAAADDATAGVAFARKGWRLTHRGRPDEALAALDAAAERFARADRPLLTAIARTYRAAAHRARGDLEAARADLRQAIAEMEAAGSADADVVRLGLLHLELDADRPAEVLGEARRLARRFASQRRLPNETSARVLACWAGARLGEERDVEGELAALREHGAGLGLAEVRTALLRLAEALAHRPDLAAAARRLAEERP